MAAKFYTAYELHAVRDRAMEIAAEGVASFYHELSSDFGRIHSRTTMQQASFPYFTQ